MSVFVENEAGPKPTPHWWQTKSLGIGGPPDGPPTLSGGFGILGPQGHGASRFRWAVFWIDLEYFELLWIDSDWKALEIFVLE